MKIKVFTFLLLLFVVWYLLYAFPPELPRTYYDDLNQVVRIGNHTILSRLYFMYASAIPSLIGAVISVISTVYAIIVFRRINPGKPPKKYSYTYTPPNKKYLIYSSVYILFSFSMLVFNSMVFWKIAKYILFYR